MNRRRIALCVLAALFAAASGWSDVTADLGATIKNATGVVDSGGPAALAQGDRVTAWLRLEGPKTVFRLRGVYALSVEEQAPTHFVDVERLSLVTTVPGDGKPLSRFEFSLGRRPVADHTGYVLAQALDGFGLAMSYPFASVSASLGTTLLPNKMNAPVVMSLGDAEDLQNTEVLMGSPRVVGLLEILFPSVLRQRVTLSLAMQEDLRALLRAGAEDSLFSKRAGLLQEGTTARVQDIGGLVDTQYSSLGLRGNIVGGLFYNAFFTLGTGRTLSFVPTETGSAQGANTYTPILAGVGGVGLSLYAEQVLGSVAGLRFVLSTGDSWDERPTVLEKSETATPNLFLPVTGRPLSLVFAPTLGNIAFIEASYSLQPFASLGVGFLERLQIGITGLVFIRPVAGPVSVAAVPEDESAYLGSEADLSVAFRPFSDLAVEVTGGLFLPGWAADDPVWWRADVTASVSF